MHSNISRFLAALVMGITALSFFPADGKCEDVRVNDVKEFLRIHEEPERYVGKTIGVSSGLGWLNPSTLNYRKSIDGYVFRFEIGKALNGAKSFGNNLILLPDQLNYVIPSEIGRDIVANWKTTGLTNYRTNITFKVVKMRLKDPIERDYHLAIVQSISRQ